jgi:hypothetical protein
MVLSRLLLLGIAASIKHASLMILSNITVSGLLLWTVQSVVIDLSEYTLLVCQLSAMHSMLFYQYLAFQGHRHVFHVYYYYSNLSN